MINIHTDHVYARLHKSDKYNALCTHRVLAASLCKVVCICAIFYFSYYSHTFITNVSRWAKTTTVNKTMRQSLTACSWFQGTKQKSEVYMQLCYQCNMQRGTHCTASTVQQSDTPQGTVVMACCSLLHCCSQPFGFSRSPLPKPPSSCSAPSGDTGLAERRITEAKVW